ncbi:hypothetical protein M1437_01105 [Patescibacteria group bacterium]|nr:hypothetical protein [Patescibacteria group bacterium]
MTSPDAIPLTGNPELDAAFERVANLRQESAMKRAVLTNAGKVKIFGGSLLGFAGHAIGASIEYSLHHKKEMVAYGVTGYATKTAVRMVLNGAGGVVIPLAAGAAAGMVRGGLKEYVKQRKDVEIEEAGRAFIVAGLKNEFRRMKKAEKGKVVKAAMWGSIAGLTGAFVGANVAEWAGDWVARNEVIQGAWSQIRADAGAFIHEHFSSPPQVDFRPSQGARVGYPSVGAPPAETAQSATGSVAVSSLTPTETATPTNLPSPTATATQSSVLIPTATSTPTESVTPSPTATGTAVSTSTPTGMPTNTATPTATPMPEKPISLPPVTQTASTTTAAEAARVLHHAEGSALADTGPAAPINPPTMPPNATGPVNAFQESILAQTTKPLPESITIPAGSNPTLLMKQYLTDNLGKPPGETDLLPDAVNRFMEENEITDAHKIPAGAKLSVHQVNNLIYSLKGEQAPDVSVAAHEKIADLSNQEYMQLKAAEVGKFLPDRDEIVHKAIESKGMIIEGKSLMNADIDHVSFVKGQESVQRLMEAKANAIYDNIPRDPQTTVGSVQEAADKAYVAWLSSTEGQHELIGAASKTIKEHLQIEEKLAQQVVDGLQSNPMFFQEVPIEQEAGKILNISGVPADAPILGANIIANYDMLTDMWETMAKGHPDLLPDAYYPVSLSEVNKLVEQAEKGDKVALNRLMQALHWIPKDGRFRKVAQLASQSVLKMIA